MVLFFGCVNPQGECGDYNGMKLTKSEVTRAASELVGKPVKMEHSGPPVGSVLSSWENSDGRLMVVGKANESDFAGKFTRNMLNCGQWTELSLSSSMPIDLKTMTTGEKRFNEVSVVAKGLRAGTHIHRLEKETAAVGYNTPGNFYSTIDVNCSANMSAAAGSSSQSAAIPMQTDGASADLQLLNRIEELEKQNAHLTSQSKQQVESLNTSAVTANAAGGGAAMEELNALPAAPAADASTEELAMYKKMVADKYTAAFSAATEQYLANLPVEDPVAREAFTNNLKRMTQDPSIGGAGGHTVMDIMCACSKNHYELNNRLESTLQELNALKESEKNENGKRAKTNFGNVASREELTNTASTDNQSNARQSAIDSLQNHGVPMKQTYDWLMQGMNARSAGMDKVRTFVYEEELYTLFC
jgi:hypothetical protein